VNGAIKITQGSLPVFPVDTLLPTVNISDPELQVVFGLKLVKMFRTDFELVYKTFNNVQRVVIFFVRDLHLLCSWHCFEEINHSRDSWLVSRNDGLQTGFSCLQRYIR